MTDEAAGQSSRDRAVTQLKKRRDFRTHLLVYLLVNGFLTAIWAVKTCTGSSGRSSRSPDGASAW